MIPTAIVDVTSLLKEANAIEQFAAHEGAFRFAIFFEEPLAPRLSCVTTAVVAEKYMPA